MPVDYAAIQKQIAAEQAKANAANAKRYQKLLETVGKLRKQVGMAGTYGQIMSHLDKLGETARARIGEQAARARASSEQDLTSRGLGNTTIRETTRRGIAAEEEKALQSAEEGLAAQKASALGNLANIQLALGQMKAGILSSRRDTGPDLGQFAALIQSAAASEKAAEKSTVRLPSTMPGGGVLSRWQAESEASAGLPPSQGESLGGVATPDFSGLLAGVTGPGAVAHGSGAVPSSPSPASFMQGGGTVFLGEHGTVSAGPAATEPISVPEATSSPEMSQLLDTAAASKIGYGGEGQPSESEANILSMAKQMAGGGSAAAFNPLTLPYEEYVAWMKKNGNKSLPRGGAVSQGMYNQLRSNLGIE